MQDINPEEITADELKADAQAENKAGTKNSRTQPAAGKTPAQLYSESQLRWTQYTTKGTPSEVFKGGKKC